MIKTILWFLAMMAIQVMGVLIATPELWIHPLPEEVRLYYNQPRYGLMISTYGLCLVLAAGIFYGLFSPHFQKYDGWTSGILNILFLVISGIAMFICIGILVLRALSLILPGFEGRKLFCKEIQISSKICPGRLSNISDFTDPGCPLPKIYWRKTMKPCYHQVGFASVLAILMLAGSLIGLPAHGGQKIKPKISYEVKGYVVPSQQAKVCAKISGNIVKMPFKVGDKVQAGNMVAQLDATEQESKYEIAAALLRTSMHRYENGKAAGISLGEIRILESNLVKAKEELKLAQNNLNATKVKSPIDGVVLRNFVQVGENVNPNGYQTPAAICLIANLDQPEIQVDIPERDIHLISAKQSCLVTLTTHPKTEFRGRVRLIEPVADRAKSTITVRVEIQVPFRTPLIRPESSATVRFLAMDNDLP